MSEEQQPTATAAASKGAKGRAWSTEALGAKSRASSAEAPEGAKAGYKKTKLGWIPEDWQTLPLSRLVRSNRRIRYGIVQAGPNDPNGIPCLRVVDLAESRIQLEKLYRTSPEISARYHACILQANDIVFALRGEIGKVVLVDEELAGINITRGVARISPSERLDPTYLYYQLQSSAVHVLIDLQVNGTSLKEIPIAGLNRIDIPVPQSLPEQRRIATILGTWDRAIATVQRLLAAQQKRKRGLMQELLSGKRRFEGYGPEGGTEYVASRIGRVPGDWKRMSMNKLFTERNERGYNELPLLSVTSTGVMLQSETDRKDSSKEDKSDYKRICPGDIGYNTMRMWQGRSAVSRIEGIVSPAYTIITPTKLMDIEYAGHLFQFPAMVHLFFRYSQGMASDTWNLKYKHFGPIVIPVPSVEEQRAIASLLSAIDRYMEELKVQLAHLTAQKRGLMQQLLTGRVRVKN